MQRQVHGWRKWLYRVLAATLVPSLFFLLGELTLRLGGFGEPTGFFVKLDDRDAYVTNSHFGWRFFPPTSARAPVVCEMPAEKPGGTYRIFILGSSAAQGFPNPAFGFGRMLSAMLRDAYPTVRFEVINTAMTAINSHVVLPIARECIHHDADLYVVYMGNNEVVGPYGSGTIFQSLSPHLAMIRASVFLKATKTGQLLSQLAASSQDVKEWQGMSMFLHHRVRADDPRMDWVYGHFRANLQDICAAISDSGAKVILCTVACNLKDSPPFASLHRAGFTESDRSKWEQLCEKAFASAESGQHRDAVKQYREAAKIDDQRADLHFVWGRSLLALERFEDAHQHFALARDLDALRFRADRRINQIIRETAAECAGRGIYLVDVVDVFADCDDTQHGIPGNELFYEHVHMNPEGNYVLAQAVFQQIAAILPSAARRDVEVTAVASRERCFELIALTDSSRFRMLEDISGALRRAPFLGQLGAVERQFNLNQQLTGLRRHMQSPAALRRDVEWYTAAIAQSPGDPELLHEFAVLLDLHGNHGLAQQHWLALLQRFPHAAAWHLEYGEFQMKEGNLSVASAEFRTAIRLDRSLAPMGYLGLANVAMKQKRPLEAERLLREAVEMNSHPIVIRSALATLLDRQGRVAEAIQEFKYVVQLDSDLAAPHANLGVIFIQQGNIAEAVEHCRELLRIEPDATESVWIMDEACQQTKNTNADYLDLYARALAAAGEFEKAIASADAASRLAETRGDSRFAAEIRNRLALYRRGKPRPEWTISVAP